MACSDPNLALQAAIRARCVASPEVMELVSAEQILDTSARPETSPLIQIGEGHTVYRRFDATAYATLHIWVQEVGLTESKQIAGALHAALTIDAQRDGVADFDGFTCLDMRVTNTQFIRDPHGPFSHGIVTVAAILKEA